MVEDKALVMARDLLDRVTKDRERRAAEKVKEGYRIRETKKRKKAVVICSHCHLSMKRGQTAAYISAAGQRRRICSKCQDRLNKNLVEVFL